VPVLLARSSRPRPSQTTYGPDKVPHRLEDQRCRSRQEKRPQRTRRTVFMLKARRRSGSSTTPRCKTQAIALAGSPTSKWPSASGLRLERVQDRVRNATADKKVEETRPSATAARTALPRSASTESSFGSAAVSRSSRNHSNKRWVSRGEDQGGTPKDKILRRDVDENSKSPREEGEEEEAKRGRTRRTSGASRRNIASSGKVDASLSRLIESRLPVPVLQARTTAD